MTNENGSNGNGNVLKINRATLAVCVVMVIALVGWGVGMYSAHEDRIRALEVSMAVMEQNTKTIMEQTDDVTLGLRELTREIDKQNDKGRH